jgi:Ser/Thr protein kinase RdoA (MazF antagonist)
MSPESRAEDAAAQQALTAWHPSQSQLERLHAGLINSTWRVDTAAGDRFILQRLHPSFPPEVNLNLECVTDWLASHECLTPRLQRTRDHALWHLSDGAVWRLMTFIDGTCFHALPSRAHATTAGRMLGDFHAALIDFNDPLPWQRPPVHEPARHRAFLLKTLEMHTGHPRFSEVAALATSLMEALDALPPVADSQPRLLHGDPKLSNLLFGPAAEARCLVDLDTLVHAGLPYEIGDALRSWCNPLAEDAPEGHFDFDFFEAALSGYAQASRGWLQTDEATQFVTATETIFIELAMRFAADTLNEAYFGWNPERFASRAEHNLLRARNQWTCARLLSAQRERAEAVVKSLFGAAR